MLDDAFSHGDLPLPALVEAVLFVAERPVTVSELAKLLDVPPDAVEDALLQLTESGQERGLGVQRHGDALQLVSHPKAAGVIQRFLGLEMSARLSPAALETLAIVAYRQPVTRSEIEAIRGVSADYTISNLLARGLVEEVGRLNTVGRPIQYGTTFEFLRAFGLSSLADLPQSGELEQLLERQQAALAQEALEKQQRARDAAEASESTLTGER